MDSRPAIVIANGNQILVAKIRQSRFSFSSKSILLKDIFHVPEVKKTLLSVYKVCRDNNLSFEFNKNVASVKDRETDVEVAIGRVRNN